MATLFDLTVAGALIRHLPDLRPTELSERAVYFSPGFDQWISGSLALVSRIGGRQLSPFEQTEQILYDYVIGRPMAYGVHHKKLEPLTQHVWELRVPDVRLIGWIPKKAHIILVRGDLKSNLASFRSYEPLISDVIAFRTALNLDLPKFVTGVLANEIL
jgi:hypothetical protein